MAGSAWHLCWAAQWAPDCCSPFWCGWIRTFGSTCANVKATCRWPNRIRSCRCRAAAEVADVGWLADTAEALAAELIRSPCPVTRLLELIRDDTFTTGTSTRRRKLRPFLEHCESWNTFIHRMRNNWVLFEWKEWARQSRIIAPRTWPRASRTAHSSASLGPQQRTVRHAEQVMQNTRVVGFLLDTHTSSYNFQMDHTAPNFRREPVFFQLPVQSWAMSLAGPTGSRTLFKRFLKLWMDPPDKLVLRVPFQAYHY